MGAGTDGLRTRIEGAVLRPGEAGYDEATSPLNTTADQRPRLVVRARSAADVAAAVDHAAATGAQVAVQATGHGAAGSLGDDVLLVDTSGLDAIEVDARSRRLRVEAGVVWGDVAAAVAPHGLAGLAGTSAGVGVVGYAARGGWGWLVRPHGLASARLTAIDYVDAEGVQRRAEGDDDVLWAYRGGGGVGIATSVEMELVSVGALRAGFMLWPIDRLGPLATAWAQALDGLPPSLSTVVQALKAAPPAPGVPEDVRGAPVAYLGLCATEPEAVLALDDALAGLGAPLADAVAETDVTGLPAIHLDPPVAVPAHGDGSFLDEGSPEHLRAVLEAAQIGPDGPLSMIELRHVARAEEGVDGALTTSPGPILLHATGSAPDAAARDAVDERLAAIRRTAAPEDPDGLVTAFGFRDGRTDAPNALPEDVAARLADLRERHDPQGIFAPARSG